MRSTGGKESAWGLFFENRPEAEAYNLELARRIKEAVTCSITVVGGFCTYEVTEKAVKKYS